LGAVHIDEPAIEIGQCHEGSESIGNASGHCLVLNDPPLFFATVDGFELATHLGVVDSQPQTLLHVLQTKPKFSKTLLQVY
jgi:hypothetical protein